MRGKSPGGKYDVPPRKILHKRKGIVSFSLKIILFLFSPITKIGKTVVGAVRGVFSKFRVANRTAAMGYIPIELFVGLCIITLGTYSYIWLFNNSKAFALLCDKRLDLKRFRRFAIIGLCSQLLFPAAILSYAAWAIIGTVQFQELAFRCSIAYAILFMLIILPQRCYYYFDLRWNLRKNVTSWDKDSIMIDRTMTSWLKLFVFGSAYIQLHTNRLMGLGMPGFADQDEIRPDFSLDKWVREYVIIKKTAAEAGSSRKGGNG